MGEKTNANLAVTCTVGTRPAIQDNCLIVRGFERIELAAAKSGRVCDTSQRKLPKALFASVTSAAPKAASGVIPRCL